MGSNPIKLLPLKLRLKFYAFKYGLYAFILLMTFMFAFLLDKHIEAIFLFVTYVIIRYMFPTTFHHPNVYWCVFWSILAMWLSIVASLPLKYSILSSVVVAIILCFVLYKVQDYIDTKERVIELSSPAPFSVKTCTKDEMLARCRATKLSSDNTEIAIAYFVEKSMSLWDIADKFSIDYDSAKQRVWRIKSKLEK